MLEIKSYGKFELLLKASRKFNFFGELKIKYLSLPWRKDYDLITISQSKTGRFQFASNNKTIDAKDNSVVKAAEYFFTNNPEQNQDIKITLTKNLPLGSGLSMRQSNAVSTFKLIYGYFNLPYTEVDILRFARIIGIEATFFVYNKPAFLTPSNGKLKFKPLLDKKLPNFDLQINHDVTPDNQAVVKQFLAHYKYYKKQTLRIGDYRNDFHQPTLDIYPRLYARYLDLKKQYRYVMLSGSGSTFICFNKL